MKARPKETITIVTTESHQVLGCSESMYRVSGRSGCALAEAVSCPTQQFIHLWLYDSINCWELGVFPSVLQEPNSVRLPICLDLENIHLKKQTPLL